MIGSEEKKLKNLRECWMKVMMMKSSMKESNSSEIMRKSKITKTK